jgi:hypothetical protein
MLDSSLAEIVCIHLDGFHDLAQAAHFLDALGNLNGFVPRLGVVLIMAGEVALADLLYQPCGFLQRHGDQPGDEQGASHGQQQGNHPPSSC